jgi:hypothetical protein
VDTTLPFAEKLRVFAVHNGVEETLAWVNEEDARRLIESRKVTLLKTKTKIRSLRVLDMHPGERISFARAELKHTRYSHNQETPQNPKNCWTLVYLPMGKDPAALFVQQIFMAVLMGAGGAKLVEEPKRKRKAVHARLGRTRIRDLGSVPVGHKPVAPADTRPTPKAA